MESRARLTQVLRPNPAAQAGGAGIVVALGNLVSIVRTEASAFVGARH